MKTKYTVTLSVLAGIAVGAAAVQGLHAQAKPKAYLISETEALDAAAVAAYGPLMRPVIDAAGGRRLNTPGSQARCHFGVGKPGKSTGLRELGRVQEAGAAA